MSKLTGAIKPKSTIESKVIVEAMLENEGIVEGMEEIEGELMDEIESTIKGSIKVVFDILKVIQ